MSFNSQSSVFSPLTYLKKQKKIHFQPYGKLEIRIFTRFAFKEICVKQEMGQSHKLGTLMLRSGLTHLKLDTTNSECRLPFVVQDSHRL